MSETEFARAQRLWSETCCQKDEIDKLRAENAELKVFMDSNQMALNAMNEERTNMIKKLSAATAQMEKMAEALKFYKTRGIIDSVRDEILKDFENEKKSSAL